MKKGILLFITMIIIASLSAGNLKFGGALEFALPMGDFADASGNGIGFNGKVFFPVNPNIHAYGSIGYIMFGGEEVTYYDGKVTTTYTDIPIVGGARYFFNPDNGFYALGELGFHMFKAEVEWESDYWGDTSDSDSESKFGFAPGAGYLHPIGNMMLDFSAKYNIIQDDLSYFSIIGGVRF